MRAAGAIRARLEGAGVDSRSALQHQRWWVRSRSSRSSRSVGTGARISASSTQLERAEDVVRVFEAVRGTTPSKTIRSASSSSNSVPSIQFEKYASMKGSAGNESGCSLRFSSGSLSRLLAASRTTRCGADQSRVRHAPRGPQE